MVILKKPPKAGSTWLGMSLYFIFKSLEVWAPVTLIFLSCLGLGWAGIIEKNNYCPFILTAILSIWMIAAYKHRPVTKLMKSTEEGRPGKAELWQTYEYLCRHLGQDMKWTRQGEQVMESGDGEDAVSLYRHPWFAMIPFQQLPEFAFKLIGLEGYSRYLREVTALLMLQDDDLYYFGSRAAWSRVGGNRFQLVAGRDEVKDRDPASESHRVLSHPGISTTDDAISFKIEERRKAQATTLMIVGSLFTAAVYLIGRQFDTGGKFSIILSILLVLLTGVVVFSAVRLLISILRLRKYRWQFSTYLSCIRHDLRERCLAFTDEDTALSNLSESLSRFPLGQVGDETLVKLRAMDRDEAVNYYRQFGELIQV